MNIKVTKITDISLLREMNQFTTGKPSKMSLADCYRYGHSNMRTQWFKVLCHDIPLFVASHLVRHHVGVQFFQRSKRTDRGGEDFARECVRLSKCVYAMGEGVREIKDGITTEYTLEDVCTDLDYIQYELQGFPDKFDRYTPTDLAFIADAEALMNMAHKRLCTKASPETREVMQAICDLVEECDPDLYPHLVPQCVRFGFCPEPRPCRYIYTDKGAQARRSYLALYGVEANNGEKES